MRALFENYDRPSQGFILRAFLPWVFVILLNVAIYEIWIPDGRSVIDWFGSLPEHLQVYAALAIVIAIAAIAGVSDGIVDLFINPLRLRSLRASEKALRRQRPGPDAPADAGDERDFNVAFLRRISGKDDDINPVTRWLAQVEEAQTAVHRGAILVMGFGISIWVNAFELAWYQASKWTSAKIVVSLAILMALALLLVAFQLRTLIALDRVVAEVPDTPPPPKGKSTVTKRASPA